MSWRDSDRAWLLQDQHPEGAITMTQYVGLDVSMKETKLHVLDDAGKRVWRGCCATEPAAIAAAVRRYAPAAVRIGLETGPLTTWLWTALTAEGLPMVCLDARHAKRALDMKVNKTDANDAEGLAHLVRAGWYREVRVKGRSAMLTKALLGARSQLLGISLALENQIRGLLKTFGRIVPKGAGGLFEKHVRALITDDSEIAAVIMPLLQARQVARSNCAALDRRLVRSVQKNAACRMLMTMPGVGPITAIAYVAALEKPETFKRSRAVAAWLGLTPRRFQSGEVDYDGHISRRGDSQLRALLYEAATVLLTRVRMESTLRRWGLMLWKRLGFKRAATALARKMAVVLHAMWKSGTAFDSKLGAATA
jgi:transposase